PDDHQEWDDHLISEEEKEQCEHNPAPAKGESRWTSAHWRGCGSELCQTFPPDPTSALMPPRPEERARCHGGWPAHPRPSGDRVFLNMKSNDAGLIASPRSGSSSPGAASPHRAARRCR